MERQPNTQYVLSLSYGKDSLATIEACKRLGYPIDRIIHAEVWFNDEIPAELPPMVEFKAKADEIIRQRYGIQVERICAMRDGEKQTYEKMFYHIPTKKNATRGGAIYGFPLNYNSKGKRTATWCKNLKGVELQRATRNQGLSPQERCLLYQTQTGSGQASGGDSHTDLGRSGARNSKKTTGFLDSPIERGAKINIVHYFGIAADEPIRIERHRKNGIIMPLVDIGWTEADCRKWCEENDLLSPTYTTATRGGCWFCHNQSVGQLRLLRRNYPNLWQHLLRLDKDSPTTFKSDGHTVHDYDARFQAEDDGYISENDKRFRWSDIEQKKNQLSIFDYITEDG